MKESPFTGVKSKNQRGMNLKRAITLKLNESDKNEKTSEEINSRKSKKSLFKAAGSLLKRQTTNKSQNHP